MCLIVFDWQPQQPQWLTLSANRDEFFRRPARAMQEWSDVPGLYAGKDLDQGGTWMGVTDMGRWAVLTNIRAPGAGPENPESRGALVLDYLHSELPPEQWLKEIHAAHYAPFNLLVGTRTQLWYLRNHPNTVIEEVPPGRHSLSNAHLDSPWPKAQLAKEQLAASAPEASALSRLLNRREPWSDDDLPATGVPLAWERLLSAQFIQAPGYGTRCSTGISAVNDLIEAVEVTWKGDGLIDKEVSFQIAIKDT